MKEGYRMGREAMRVIWLYPKWEHDIVFWCEYFREIP